jgi:hypothetical protein
MPTLAFFVQHLVAYVFIRRLCNYSVRMTAWSYGVFEECDIMTVNWHIVSYERLYDAFYGKKKEQSSTKFPCHIGLS